MVFIKSSTIGQRPASLDLKSWSKPRSVSYRNFSFPSRRLIYIKIRFLFRRDDPEAAPWTEEGKTRIEKFSLWKISEKTADKEKKDQEGEENEGEGNAEDKPKKKRGRKRKNEEISAESDEENEEETKPKKTKKAKIDKTDSPTKNGSTLDNFFKRDGAASPDKTKKKTPEKKEAANGTKKAAAESPSKASKATTSYLDSDDEDDDMSRDIRKRIRDDPNQAYWREIFDRYILKCNIVLVLTIIL